MDTSTVEGTFIEGSRSDPEPDVTAADIKTGSNINDLLGIVNLQIHDDSLNISPGDRLKKVTQVDSTNSSINGSAARESLSQLSQTGIQLETDQNDFTSVEMAGNGFSRNFEGFYLRNDNMKENVNSSTHNVNNNDNNNTNNNSNDIAIIENNSANHNVTENSFDILDDITAVIISDQLEETEVLFSPELEPRGSMGTEVCATDLISPVSSDLSCEDADCDHVTDNKTDSACSSVGIAQLVLEMQETDENGKEAECSNSNHEVSGRCALSYATHDPPNSTIDIGASEVAETVSRSEDTDSVSGDRTVCPVHHDESGECDGTSHQNQNQKKLDISDNGNDSKCDEITAPAVVMKFNQTFDIAETGQKCDDSSDSLISMSNLGATNTPLLKGERTGCFDDGDGEDEGPTAASPHAGLSDDSDDICIDGPRNHSDDICIDGPQGQGRGAGKHDSGDMCVLEYDENRMDSLEFLKQADGSMLMERAGRPRKKPVERPIVPPSIRPKVTSSSDTVSSAACFSPGSNVSSNSACSYDQLLSSCRGPRPMGNSMNAGLSAHSPVGAVVTQRYPAILYQNVLTCVPSSNARPMFPTAPKYGSSRITDLPVSVTGIEQLLTDNNSSATLADAHDAGSVATKDTLSFQSGPSEDRNCCMSSLEGDGLLDKTTPTSLQLPHPPSSASSDFIATGAYPPYNSYYSQEGLSSSTCPWSEVRVHSNIVCPPPESSATRIPVVSAEKGIDQSEVLAMASAEMMQVPTNNQASRLFDLSTPKNPPTVSLSGFVDDVRNPPLLSVMAMHNNEAMCSSLNNMYSNAPQQNQRRVSPSHLVSTGAERRCYKPQHIQAHPSTHKGHDSHPSVVSRVSVSQEQINPVPSVCPAAALLPFSKESARFSKRMQALLSGQVEVYPPAHINSRSSQTGNTQSNASTRNCPSVRMEAVSQADVMDAAVVTHVISDTESVGKDSTEVCEIESGAKSRHPNFNLLSSRKSHRVAEWLTDIEYQRNLDSGTFDPSDSSLRQNQSRIIGLSGKPCTIDHPQQKEKCGRSKEQNKRKTSIGNKTANSRTRKISPSTSNRGTCSTKKNRTKPSNVGEGLPSSSAVGHREQDLTNISPLDMAYLKDTDTLQKHARSKDKEIQEQADMEIAKHIHFQRFVESQNYESSQNKNLSSWEQHLLSIISDPQASDTQSPADKVVGTGKGVCPPISHITSSIEYPSFDLRWYITPSIKESLEKDRGKKEKDSFDAYLVPEAPKEIVDGGSEQQFNSTEDPLLELKVEEINRCFQEVSKRVSDHQCTNNSTLCDTISDNQKTLKRKPTDVNGAPQGAQSYHSESKPSQPNLILSTALPQGGTNVFTSDVQPHGSHVEKRQMCRPNPVSSVHGRKEPTSRMGVPFHKSTRSSPECKDHEASSLDHKIMSTGNTSHPIAGQCHPQPQFGLEQMIEAHSSCSPGFVKPLLQPLTETAAITPISSHLDSDFSMRTENSFPSLSSMEDFFLGQTAMLPSLESDMSVSLNDSLIKEAEKSVLQNHLLEQPHHLQHQRQQQQYHEQQLQQQQQQYQQQQPQQQQKQQQQQQYDMQLGSCGQISALHQQLYGSLSQPNCPSKSQSQQFQLLQQSQQQAYDYKPLHQQQLSQSNHLQTMHQQQLSQSNHLQTMHQQQLSQSNHLQTMHQHQHSPPGHSQLLQQQQQLQSHYQTQTQQGQFQQSQLQHYQTFQQRQLQQQQQQQPNQSPSLEELQLQQQLLFQSQILQQHSFQRADMALAPGQYLPKVDHNIHYNLDPQTTSSASAITEAATLAHFSHTHLPQHLQVRTASSMKGETSRNGHNATVTATSPSPPTTFRQSPQVEATIPSTFCNQLGSEQQLSCPPQTHQLMYHHKDQEFLKLSASAVSPPSPFRTGTVCNSVYSLSPATSTLHDARNTYQPITACTTSLEPPSEADFRLASAAASSESQRRCGFENPPDQNEFDIMFNMDTNELDLAQNRPCTLSERGPSSALLVPRGKTMERKTEESTAAAANAEKIERKQQEMSPKGKTTPTKAVEQRKKSINEVTDVDLEAEILQVESLSLESSLGCSSLEPDSEGETCLHLLCDLSKEFLEMLPSKPGLKRALNLQSKNNEETALFIAVKKKNIDVVRFLLFQGADPNKLCRSHAMNSPTERLQQTALHEAVMIGHREIVQELLTAQDIEVDARQPGSGLTPLMLACSLHAISNRCNIIFLLLGHGASLTLAEYVQGKSPLMLAIQSRKVDLVEDLLRFVGVEKARRLVMARSKTGITCLHLAAELRIDSEEKQRLLQLIIRAGGDLSAKNDEGETAKDWARAEITQVIQNLARSTNGK